MKMWGSITVTFLDGDTETIERGRIQTGATDIDSIHEAFRLFRAGGFLDYRDGFGALCSINLAHVVKIEEND